MAYSSSLDHSASTVLPRLDGNTICSPTFGDLLLEEEIGRGGYGIVYRAVTMNKVEPREFAVKCICNPERDRHKEHLAATELNLHRICSKASSHVLKLADVYIDNDVGITYMITELCTTDLLDKIMHGDFQGQDKLIRAAFLQIIDAVQACHDVGVYHRDLKPENIFCRKDGSCVLGDFGLATTSKYTKDFYTGSEPFMSPEVLGGIRNEHASFSSACADIWALGVIFLNITTSRLPWVRARAFDADSAMSHPPPGHYGFRCSFFERFLRSPEGYFCPPHSHFGLSRDASDLLTCIFTIDPRKRIPLHELRRGILTIPTFYAKPVNHASKPAAKKQQRPLSWISIIDSDRSFDTDSSSLYSTSLDASSHDDIPDIGGRWYHRTRFERGLIKKFQRVPKHRSAAGARSPSYPSQSATKHHVGRQEGRKTSPNHRSHALQYYQSGSNQSVTSDGTSSSDSNGPSTPEMRAQYVGVANIKELNIGTMTIESIFVNGKKPEVNVVLHIAS